MKKSNNLALRLALDAKSQSLKKRNSNASRGKPSVREVYSKPEKSESDIAEIIPTAKSPPPEFNSSEDDSTSQSGDEPVEHQKNQTKHSSADSGVGSTKNQKNQHLNVSASFAHSMNP